MPITWTLTLDKFIARVLVKCGYLDAAETVDGGDYAFAKDSIDGVLKSMHADGLLWWAVKTSPLTFTSASLARPEDCVECLFAYWFDGGDRKVRIIERQEYEAIPHKEDTGTPEVLFDDNGTLRIHPVPSSGTLRLTYQREILDTADATALDIPKKLLQPLIEYIACEVGPDFGAPASRMQLLLARKPVNERMLRRLSTQSAEPGEVSVDYF